MNGSRPVQQTRAFPDKAKAGWRRERNEIASKDIVSKKE